MFRIAARTVSVSILFLTVATGTAAQSSVETAQASLVRVVDLNVGEERRLKLHDGSRVTVELLGMKDRRDPVIGAVREVSVSVKINGEEVTVTAGNYELPISAGNVQIDCPVTIHYPETSTEESWGLEKDARLRLWSSGSPWIRSETFVYPVAQEWLASETWYSNEPVRAREEDGKIYYHDGMDIGGAEGLVDVVSATDGLVVSVGGDVLEGHPQPPVDPRYDVVYIRDVRGWYYRYSHLDQINAEVELGEKIEAGQPIGVLGKEGASGGWSHLHFEIKSKQPSGKWGTQDSYAFLWQAYQRQYDPELLAIARPRRWAYVGDSVTLDGTRSWAEGQIASYRWTLSDGSMIEGPVIDHRYERPGRYSEILKVTDKNGRVDFDFTTVRVVKKDDERNPPSLHAAYYPTFDIQPGEKVIFKVREERMTEGYEVWDFGDGSDPDTTRSNVDPGPHAEVGYATTTHRFDSPGHYIVTVRRTNEYGEGVDRLHVHVEPPEE